MKAPSMSKDHRRLVGLQAASLQRAQDLERQIADRAAQLEKDLLGEAEQLRKAMASEESQFRLRRLEAQYLKVMHRLAMVRRAHALARESAPAEKGAKAEVKGPLAKALVRLASGLAPLLKARVKGHWRTTEAGKMVWVAEHQDKRTKKAPEPTTGRQRSLFDEPEHAFGGKPGQASLFGDDEAPARVEEQPKAAPVQREHAAHFKVSADTKWERLDRNRRIPILPGRSTVTRTVDPPPPATPDSYAMVWRADEFYPSEGEYRLSFATPHGEQSIRLQVVGGRSGRPGKRASKALEKRVQKRLPEIVGMLQTWVPQSARKWISSITLNEAEGNWGHGAWGEGGDRNLGINYLHGIGDHIYDVVAHEVGHFVAKSLGPDGLIAFEEETEKPVEVRVHISSYAWANAEEDFAEMWTAALINPALFEAFVREVGGDDKRVAAIRAAVGQLPVQTGADLGREAADNDGTLDAQAQSAQDEEEARDEADDGTAARDKEPAPQDQPTHKEPDWGVFDAGERRWERGSTVYYVGWRQHQGFHVGTYNRRTGESDRAFEGKRWRTLGGAQRALDKFIQGFGEGWKAVGSRTVQEQKPAPEQPATVKASGARISTNADFGSTEVSFPSKPDRGVLDKLKTAGFRWSSRNKVWYSRGADAKQKAEAILGKQPEETPETIPTLDEAHKGRMASLEARTMTQTVAQTYTEKLEAAYVTIDTRTGFKAIENRADFVAYVANDVFQVAADRAQAAGVELPAEQMQIMEAAALRLAGRDAEFWASHSTGFTSRSADWGKLLMAEVRS